MKPQAAEAADKVMASLKEQGGLKSQLTKDKIKENGLLAGGAVVAADGVRHMARKDETANAT